VRLTQQELTGRSGMITMDQARLRLEEKHLLGTGNEAL
jgi:hypothetical protein